MTDPIPIFKDKEPISQNYKDIVKDSKGHEERAERLKKHWEDKLAEQPIPEEVNATYESDKPGSLGIKLTPESLTELTLFVEEQRVAVKAKRRTIEGLYQEDKPLTSGTLRVDPDSIVTLPNGGQRGVLVPAENATEPAELNPRSQLETSLDRLYNGEEWRFIRFGERLLEDVESGAVKPYEQFGEEFGEAEQNTTVPHSL